MAQERCGSGTGQTLPHNAECGTLRFAVCAEKNAVFPWFSDGFRHPEPLPYWGGGGGGLPGGGGGGMEPDGGGMEPDDDG
jgi:hypothetical protein